MGKHGNTSCPRHLSRLRSGPRPHLRQPLNLCPHPCPAPSREEDQTPHRSPAAALVSHHARRKLYASWPASSRRRLLRLRLERVFFVPSPLRFAHRSLHMIFTMHSPGYTLSPYSSSRILVSCSVTIHPMIICQVVLCTRTIFVVPQVPKNLVYTCNHIRVVMYNVMESRLYHIIRQ
jgi:hypothetical protein